MQEREDYCQVEGLFYLLLFVLVMSYPFFKHRKNIFKAVSFYTIANHGKQFSCTLSAKANYRFSKAIIQKETFTGVFQFSHFLFLQTV